LREGKRGGRKEEYSRRALFPTRGKEGWSLSSSVGPERESKERNSRTVREKRKREGGGRLLYPPNFAKGGKRGGRVKSFNYNGKRKGVSIRTQERGGKKKGEERVPYPRPL